MSELMTMLNAKTQRYESGGGGVSKLTPCMVASALAGLAPTPYHLGLVIHCDAPAYQLNDLLMQGAAERFGVSSLESMVTVAGCAALAIYKVAALGACPTCRGEGMVTMQPTRGMRQCLRCNGSGFAKISEREAAQRLRVTRHGWRTHYKKVYEAFVSDLELALSELERHVRKKLR